MNKNVESRFSHLPSANIQRSRFDRSQDVKLTFNVGELIPFYVDEVLPGDTFEITTSMVARLQTLLTPVMDNLYVDIMFWFVPNRLTWDHWKNFMGESDKAWLPETTYNVPTCILIDTVEGVGSGAVKVGDVLDYMGVPVNVSAPYGSETGPAINCLPLRAYQLIYNDWWRDENIIDPVNIYTGDSSLSYGTDFYVKKPYKVAKFHDYFTSALPNRAKLASLGAPFEAGSVGLPVYGYNTGSRGTIDVVTTNSGFSERNIYGSSLHGHALDSDSSVINEVYARQYNARNSTDDGDVPVIGRNGIDAGISGFIPDNLIVNVANHPMIGMFDIVSLRYAFQVQKYYETMARSGSRYTEILEGIFSVKSPDARLQRPEYLGGKRIPISIHQITNQSQGEKDFLGDLGAMSLTTDKSGMFVKSFVEHGFCIGTICARYDHSYPQGLERFWFRNTREEYYFPQFANISEQKVLKGEIYLDNDNSEHTFGFQEAWADYRYKPNKVMAEMRPGIPNTLDSWHFADYYEEAPTLSQGWIEEDKTNVDRTLAVTSENANQIFCDIYVQNFATRPMPLYSIPGLADHH